MANNPNLHKVRKSFSATNKPNAAAIKKRAATNIANTKKRRELRDLLNISVKGKFGEEINAVLLEKLGIQARTIEEALHFVQIAKAIGEDDTQAYMALMQTSGLNKPIKIAPTDTAGNDIIFKLDDRFDNH